MVNIDHLRILEEGVDAWNRWREENPKIKPDLRGANLENFNLLGINLDFADLSGADLFWANLSESELNYANLNSAFLQRSFFIRSRLVGADLCSADLCSASFEDSVLNEAKFNNALLYSADLNYADLVKSELQNAELISANLNGSDLSGSDLTGANLTNANLVEANLNNARLTNCRIYGVSAWNIKGRPLDQSNLIITQGVEPDITLDDLEVAQFIHFFLYNENIRHVIDTMTSKVVLILGRFNPERKQILKAIQSELRKRDYVPVIFDFEKPKSQDFLEPVSLLAHLSKFIIADFTEAKVILEEVPHIVRNVAVPVKPILAQGLNEEPVTLFNLRRNQKSILDTFRYQDLCDLIKSLDDKVIKPAEEKSIELRGFNKS